MNGIQYLGRIAGRLRLHNQCTTYAKAFATYSPKFQSTGKLQWSYSHGISDVPLCGATIGQKLAESAEKYPHRDAHVFPSQDVRINFEQLIAKSDELASGLFELGLQKGDRVGIWAPNCPEWIITQYGAARAGIILVNINPAYQTHELEYALRKVGVKAIIAAETFKTQDYYGMLREICPELDTAMPGDLNAKKLPQLKSIIMISDKKLNGTFSFNDVMEASTNQKKQLILDMQDGLQFDDPINIQFTSGTTGNPKGALLTHHNILNNARYIGLQMEYQNKDHIVCVPAPLFHCMGMVLGSLTSILFGATIVYPSLSFKPEPTLEAMHKERCTSIIATPTMFIDMLASQNLDSYDLTSMSTGIMAGSPCPIEVMKATMTKLHMPQVTVAYGTTENSPVTFQGRLNDTIEKKTSTIGQAHPHVEAKIVNEAGEIVPIGQSGELCTRGYLVMLGYWDDPVKTEEVIGPDRWYKSGDMAIMDEEGYAQIVGRIKDMIIRGGENIYPVEVENLLYKHPAISDVQIIGVPDKRLGEQVCACVILKPGHSATEQDIKDFCKGKISHFKIPHYVTFTDEFPLTISGKIQKYKLRQDFAANLEAKN